MDLLAFGAGYVFASRYKIARPLGYGGMGAVYEARDLETERRRAIKILLPHLCAHPVARARFLQEARVGGRVDSPFVVDVFDAGIDATTGFPYLVMELLRGEDLGRRIGRLGPRPPAEVVEQLRQVALALDSSHRAGIVHRDIKPANLFAAVSDDDAAATEPQVRMKVLDFGIAALASDGTGFGTGPWGTPAFMAPEQIAGERVTCASDLYALAHVAFALLAGKPYREANGDAAPQSACERAAKLGVVLPTAFDAWFARAAAAVPAHRFESAAETVTTLAAALGVTAPRFATLAPAMVESAAPGVALTTVPPTIDRAAALPRTPWRRRAGWTAAGALLIGGAVFALAPTRTPPPAPLSKVVAAAGTKPTSAAIAPVLLGPPAGDLAVTVSPASPLPVRAVRQRRARAHAAPTALPREHLYSRD